MFIYNTSVTLIFLIHKYCKIKKNFYKLIVCNICDIFLILIKRVKWENSGKQRENGVRQEKKEYKSLFLYLSFVLSSDIGTERAIQQTLHRAYIKYYGLKAKWSS